MKFRPPSGSEQQAEDPTSGQSTQGVFSPPSACARILLGPMGNRESRDRQAGVLEGVPAMGLDGLSSSACGWTPPSWFWRHGASGL